MKCRECNCCKQGWYPYLPNHFVCTGVPEPFVIKDIDAECPEYQEERNTITIEDAITHFKYGISHDIFSEPVTTYARMAVEALKKQNPMEHHHTVVGECSGGEKMRTSICPNCLGCIITVAEEFPRFCDWCGQAIDWER